MNLNEREDIYIKAIKEWGENSQLDQAIEEMAELIVAINKYKRINMDLANKREELLENLIEEIADTKMCLEQLELMFGKEKISKMLDLKMQKFLKCFKNKK